MNAEDLEKMAQACKERWLLVLPQYDRHYQLQFSVHKCPKLLNEELQHIFPEMIGDNVLVVPTFQPSTIDLMETSPEVDKEKDRLLTKFVTWGTSFKGNVELIEKRDKSFSWTDMSDPCSGHPVFGDRSSMFYSEIEGMTHFFTLDTSEIGGCAVLAHPLWNTSAYPATLFTTAPLNLVKRILIGRIGAGL